MDLESSDAIGLNREAVRIIDHRPEWAAIFDAEREVIRSRSGDLIVDIQHVGSTSIPGMPAKPIIDIAIAVRSREAFPLLAARLVEAGYIDRGDLRGDGGYLMVKESAPDVRTIHVHFAEETDQQWVNLVGFRDALRRDEEVRRRYAELKKELAERFKDDRASYTASKNEFIQAVLNASRDAPQDESGV
jgi:GrpB-like predicted nucleotidyltransferase (UPF0157 family)